MNAFTTTLTSGSLTISGADGVMALSVQADATAAGFELSFETDGESYDSTSLG